MDNLLIGCVADDFTGASDAASFLVKEGIPTILYNEIPTPDEVLPPGVKAAVIALKSRTIDAQEAVAISLKAFAWLEKAGAQKLYFKYCSTFDSTEKGNIGPVVDSMLRKYDLPFTLLCPSLPINGRTVKKGCLYVNGIMLHESHMKDHPLTPMRQSGIKTLIESQGSYQGVEIGEVFMTDKKELASALKQECLPFYVIPDYYEDAHGDGIIEAFPDLKFYTGGSGLIGSLGAFMAKALKPGEADLRNPAAKGQGVILAGSCSAITLQQIEDYKRRGRPSYKIEPGKLLTGEESIEGIWQWLKTQKEDALIYSSEAPDKILANQANGQQKIAERIEETLSGLAVLCRLAGYKRFIIAGGETSGGVTKALGYQSFYINESIAPGVPIMIPQEEEDVRLVLKSGNFGQTDFFFRASNKTSGD